MNSMTQNESELSRRAFARFMTLGAVAVPGLVTSGAAQETPAADQPGPGLKPGKAASEESPSELESLAGLILRRYGDDRLDEKAVTGILRDIQGDLVRGRVLSRFPLTNADEPAFTFAAWRADDPVQ